MTILNSVAKIMPGYGSGVTYQNTNVLVATTTANIVVPGNTYNSANVFFPNLTAGKVRVQSVYGFINSNATSKCGGIWGSDGTNIVQLYPGDPSASTNNQNYCLEVDWITDFLLSSINVQMVTGNNGVNFDVEVSGVS